MDGAAWVEYLAGFHAERPGITEGVLRRAFAGADDPYEWLLEAVPERGRVLDVACGSAPLWPYLAGRSYLGVDTSTAELSVARARGAHPTVRASAARLPVGSRTVDVVVCSMSLQIVQPLPDVLAEVGRILAPGGRLVAIIPDRAPLGRSDVVVLAGLLGALGHGLGYPNDAVLRRLPELLATAGLRLAADERRRFCYRLGGSRDADRYLASLYLPGLPASRYQVARRWLRMLSHMRIALPVPIRRTVIVRDRAL